MATQSKLASKTEHGVSFGFDGETASLNVGKTTGDGS